MKNQELTDLLKTNLQPLQCKLDDKLLREFIRDFHDWESAAGQSKGKDEGLIIRVIVFLSHTIEEDRNRIVALRARFTEFSKRYSGAATLEEKQEHILDFSKDLGATQRQLRGDKRAFSRWFGADAITERYQKQIAALERKIAFSLDRLGAITAHLLQIEEAGAGHDNIVWRKINMESSLKPFLDYDGDQRVRIEAFRCLAKVLKGMPEESHAENVEEHILQYVFRAALDRRQPIWIQCEALQLMENLSLNVLEVTLKKRLSEPSDGDDLFVRSRAVKILGENLQRLPALRELFQTVAEDPSPYVRQAMVHSLTAAAEDDLRIWLHKLARHDSVPQVRATALLHSVSLLERRELFGFLLNLLSESFAQEADSFVLRVALKVSAEGLGWLIRTGEAEDAEQWYTTLLTSIEKLRCDSENLSVRRWAARTRENMWCHFDPRARELAQRLAPKIQQLKPGKKKRLPRSLFSVYDEDLFGRVLAVMGQDDFGYDVKRDLFGATIVRGHRFTFRFWRFFYELLHPSPEKRQAFPHTIGRTFSGKIHCPSGIMGELTPTKVPGEPLYMSEESGWRPYLPLVDEILSSLDNDGAFRRRPTRIYTNEGITEIRPPAFFVKRWWAKIRLNLMFADYARLRNWHESDQRSPASYLEALSKLGFRITFNSYASERANIHPDPAVTRFFGSMLPFIGMDFGTGIGETVFSLLKSDSWLRLKEYFFSVYENSLSDLGIFTALLLLLFMIRSVYLKQIIRKARTRIPLVIGGWGTRGKSSVERMKGALFNAMGYGVLSKTTGCEAMFLHAHPYHKLREMFLFRPYGKATIWEQHNLTRLAERLDIDVFLWECMGLTPSYVHILQREWMKDDLATITNTYPDHEDLQGPAGINIPEVMTHFIPESSTLITTEEHMLPILAHSARTLDTRIRSVNWLEAGLITSDILARFSYEEHPYNIALILAMAEELRIDRDFALKEIADHVIPDIGVLKIYPTAPLKTRHLEFISGNSANERLAALGNWERAGLHRHDPEEEPHIWITTVVNNRADRIPRSQVFARLLVEDVSADRHVLIGSNLSGFSGYIQEAWDEYAQQFTLWPLRQDLDKRESGDTQLPQEIFTAKARHLRIPTSEDQIKARLGAMLTGVLRDMPGEQEKKIDPEQLIELWHDPEDLQKQLYQLELKGISDAIIRFLKQDLARYEEYRSFWERLQQYQPGQEAHLNDECRKLLWKWFESKIIIIWDYHASGDQINNKICEETPPGLYARIMGLQNIKGTGLDFVYSWQRWEKCFTACNMLLSGNPSEVDQGLRTLSGFQEYNTLCEEHTRQIIHTVKDLPIAQNEHFQAELNMIQSNLESAMARVSAKLELRHSSSSGWTSKIIELLEAFQDAGDAIRRRKIANRIYQDLVDERIGHERAAMELQALEKRQKGGWLSARMQEFFQRKKTST